MKRHTEQRSKKHPGRPRCGPWRRQGPRTPHSMAPAGTTHARAGTTHTAQHGAGRALSC